MSSGYRLAPALAARLLGLVLVVLALGVVVVTVLTALLDWSAAVILVSAATALAVVAAAWWLLRGVRVVVLDSAGYRVRLVRGAGVTSATWREVADAVTADAGGVDCVVLRLRDGRATSIPVVALAADRNAFVADVRRHLRDAEGLRPL